MPRTSYRHWSLVGTFAALSWGCSAAGGAGSSVRVVGPAAGAADIPEGASSGSTAAGGGSQLVDVTPSGGSASAGSGGNAACATKKAEAAIVRQPVDIIVVIDNSGSMQDEIDAVERSINVNFANVLTTSGVDYRVILISRHEKAKRQTSICVVAPLSSNTICPPTPDQPAFSERFYQYSLKVDSLNSLVLITDTYNATVPDEFHLAPTGWSAWLRPAAQKVFLEITDDNSTLMTSADFETKLFALSPENFGSVSNRKYVFHSIIGIGEKGVVTDAWLPSEGIQSSECTGNGDTVENPGLVYQELSRMTGGLRFPICQFNAFNTVFETIATTVVSHTKITCEFAIPPAPGADAIDLSKVAVSYDAGDGSGVKTFGQAMAAQDCVPDAFYIDAARQQIVLCPDACAGVQTGAKPSVDVLFTCAPTYIPPPK